MGLTHVGIEVGNENGGAMVAIPDIMVDTGTFNTMLPEELLDRLHVERKDTVLAQFADGEKAERFVGQVNIKIEGQPTAWRCPVYFDPTNTNCLLGATTLEIFNLMVDPVDGILVKRIIKARPF